MDPFEVHITGDHNIHDAAKILGLKTITIDLLRPDGSLLRTEHMTSVVRKFPTIGDAIQMIGTWKHALKTYGVRIIRTKLEVPPLEKYEAQSLYMESHFETDDFIYPTSQNRRSKKLLATDRVLDKSLYTWFKTRHKDHELELCVHDSFMDEDIDWFSQYKTNPYVEEEFANV